jgi:NADH-quinone oxidoreductase subunit M
MGLTLLLIIPLVGAAIAASVPNRQIGPVAALTTLVQVGFVIPLLINFKTSAGLQGSVNEDWISQLGIHYALGLDGLNVFMIALTVGAWTIATFAASYREWENPRLFYVLMAVAEVGTLGAFLAQDLILFILFFDLLLIPFYLLIGSWGQSTDEVDRRAATLKFVIYTLVGSLLMLAAAVGLGVASSSQNDTALSFLFTDLSMNPVSGGLQQVIFIGFALALLVKMPIPPFHGWMPDTYKATPLPVLIVLSAVVAKLGAYGFLRIVLPLMPSAADAFQHVMLVLAIIGIVYGSVMAFSQDNARLVVGYSSIAQIGFVLLGIFSLDPKGSEGAILQMINHGIVVVALFLIIGYLADRAGSESLSEMGGLAKSAPVFAGLFLIVTFATLAMPGSANFVGEVYILFGAFNGAFWYGIVASVGVALAAVYMIRFFQRSMHNPESAEGHSRELNGSELGLLVPAVLAILALAIYPQYLVTKVEPAAKTATTAAGESGSVAAASAPAKIAEAGQ